MWCRPGEDVGVVKCVYESDMLVPERSGGTIGKLPVKIKVVLVPGMRVP